MEDKQVVVKQNPIAARILSFVTALVWVVFAIGTLLISDNDNISARWVAFGLGIAAVLFFFIALTAKLFVLSEEIYSETGMIRKRGKKILYEIAWDKVEQIIYHKLSLISILMLCPTAFFIFQKEPIENKNQPKTFLACYSMKEVKKIQTVIPLTIQY